MAGLSAKDFAKIYEYLPKLYRIQSLDDFAATVIQIIPQIVQSDVTAYSEMYPRLHRFVGAMSSPESEAIFLKHRPSFEEFFHQHPLIQHFQRVEEGNAKKISDFLTLKQWQETAIYQEFYRNFGLTRQMVLTLPIEKPGILGIALNRMRRDFSEHDRRLLNYLLPHVTQAYQNAITYTELTQQVLSLGQALEALNAGVIELDHAREVIRISEIANNVLTSFFPSYIQNSRYMPPDIDEWLLEQVKILRDQHSTTERVRPYIIRQERSRLTLRVMKASESDGFIVTTEQYIAFASWETLQLEFELTGREAEILLWVAQGKSNAEIAIVLGISPRTVQKHLESVFEKLKVETRVQAAIKATHALTNR